MKTKFIVVGTGNRGLGCFAKGLLAFDTKGLPEFRERADLVALVDTNEKRGRAAAVEIKLPDLPVFPDIASASAAVDADWAIVTTPDFTHADVVCAALKSGLNVLVDKPLATSAWECDRIISTMNDTGRKVLVGHNMRYQDYTLQAAKLVRSGGIGEILSLEAAEVLDYSHGGDYFHRWHSIFGKSAGLMNHKCCHHLDVINWILDDDPVEVSAFGTRSFYRERPDMKHGDRCSECGISGSCPHYFDMDKWDGIYRRIYKDAESADGYVRDLCVFSERHTINDHESLNIRYRKGTLASFYLLTYAPKEFSYFYFTGTEGRMEMGHDSATGKPYLRVLRPSGAVEEIAFEKGRGEHGHGGADIKLIADILGLEGSEPLQRAVPAEARRAVLIADLAARSIAGGGRPVKAEEAGGDYPPEPPRPQ
ncbi:MAG: Gfo/Idh/MocA family oxidoreductase [Planctomycetes bacterium]|nr:Gfo/Idh/MocA family oxidoreductase [Planctomycetota bacterium]